MRTTKSLLSFRIVGTFLFAFLILARVNIGKGPQIAAGLNDDVTPTPTAPIQQQPLLTTPTAKPTPVIQLSRSPEGTPFSRLQVSRGNNVELVGQLGGGSRAVAGQDNYVYVGDGPNLVVIDVSNPTNPSVMGRTAEGLGLVESIYVDSGHAYVAANTAGLRVVDVSNPTDPREIGHYEMAGVAEGVYVVGSYAYVAAEYSGLYVIDVSDPTLPQEVGHYQTSGSTLGVYVAGDYAYIVGDFGLHVVAGVNSPDALRKVAECKVVECNISNTVHDIDVIGSYAYLSTESSGFLVVDISDPSSPEALGSSYPQSNFGGAGGVSVEGRYAYVAAGSASS